MTDGYRLPRALSALAAMALLATPIAAGCAKEAPPITAPATVVAPVIYGADDRTDWYAVEDEAIRKLARDTVVVMIDWSEITLDGERARLAGGPSHGQDYGLCPGQRFYNQPSHGSCSGTLVGEQLVLTAGHCVTGYSDCGRSAWVFDYLYTEAGGPVALDADDVYRCVDIIAHGWAGNSDIDFAVIQLDRPVVGRTPARIRGPEPLAVGDSQLMIGFPSGLPMKIDAGGLVAQPRAWADDYYIASVDAFGGNSGSGVFDANLTVAGILSDGADDFDYSRGCGVVAQLDPDEAEESVYYAHHAATAVCARGFPSHALCGPDANATCGDGFCTGSEIVDGCGADCDSGLFAVPEEWTCNPGWYDVGDDCDCGCGAYDPDCDDSRLDILNCAPGATCQADGTCTATIPDAWQCRYRYYGVGDDCDCDCGAYDPDCDNPNLDIVNCRRGQVCSDAGRCVAPEQEPPDPGPEPVVEQAPESPAADTTEGAETATAEVPTVAEPDPNLPVHGVAGTQDGGCSGGTPPTAPIAFALWFIAVVTRRRFWPVR